MNGFCGGNLKIDLTDEKFDLVPLNDEMLLTYLGGKGLASYLLYSINLPKRFYKEILKTGHIVKETDLEAMLKEYYTLRGWNENGVPKVKPAIS